MKPKIELGPLSAEAVGKVLRALQGVSIINPVVLHSYTHLQEKSLYLEFRGLRYSEDLESVDSVQCHSFDVVHFHKDGYRQGIYLAFDDKGGKPSFTHKAFIYYEDDRIAGHVNCSYAEAKGLVEAARNLVLLFYYEPKHFKLYDFEAYYNNYLGIDLKSRVIRTEVIEEVSEKAVKPTPFSERAKRMAKHADDTEAPLKSMNLFSSAGKQHSAEIKSDNSSNIEAQDPHKLRYVVDARKEGHRVVFDVFDEDGRLLWQGMGVNGLSDVFKMVDLD